MRNPGSGPALPPGARAELVRLVRRIQAPTLEREETGQRELDPAEIEAKKRLLEQLRWQLAAVARRTATDELGSTA